MRSKWRQERMKIAVRSNIKVVYTGKGNNEWCIRVCVSNMGYLNIHSAVEQV